MDDTEVEMAEFENGHSANGHRQKIPTTEVFDDEIDNDDNPRPVRRAQICISVILIVVCAAIFAGYIVLDTESDVENVYETTDSSSTSFTRAKGEVNYTDEEMDEIDEYFNQTTYLDKSMIKDYVRNQTFINSNDIKDYVRGQTIGSIPAGDGGATDTTRTAPPAGSSKKKQDVKAWLAAKVTKRDGVKYEIVGNRLKHDNRAYL
jgi:hypothetical protein